MRTNTATSYAHRHRQLWLRDTGGQVDKAAARQAERVCRQSSTATLTLRPSAVTHTLDMESEGGRGEVREGEGGREVHGKRHRG